MDAIATVSLHFVLITPTCRFAVQVAYDFPKDFFRLTTNFVPVILQLERAFSFLVAEKGTQC